MTVARRMGPENAATRTTLMDATEAVMREEGYAALSSRRVAERAGVNQQTVYYYFENMDELLLAAYRRRMQMVLERVERAMVCENPLHAYWDATSDPADAALTIEYLALANHNERVRQETVEFGERLRRLESQRLGHLIEQHPANGGADASPLGVIMAITYIGYLLGFEAMLGIKGGHKDVRRLIGSWLAQVEPGIKTGS